MIKCNFSTQREREREREREIKADLIQLGSHALGGGEEDQWQ